MLASFTLPALTIPLISSVHLEWSTTSPPARYNYAYLPTVRSRYPLWADPADTPVVAPWSPEKRVALCTTILDAQPEHRYVLCQDSWLPFALALITGIFFTILVFTPWIVPICAALWAIVPGKGLDG